MRASSQWEKPVLLTPLVLFSLMMLGFPSLLNIIYSFSAVDFHNLRSPQWQGWQNHAEVLADESFWRALGFSCRFGLITAFIETLLGLALAVYLAPLMGPHRWILAILMLPLMVAPSMMGLMYRLVLHEFVGPLSYYGAMVLENTPSFLGQDWAFTTLVVMEVMQWTPFTLLLLFTAYQSLPQDVREAALEPMAAAKQVHRHDADVGQQAAAIGIELGAVQHRRGRLVVIQVDMQVIDLMAPMFVRRDFTRITQDHRQPVVVGR